MATMAERRERYELDSRAHAERWERWIAAVRAAVEADSENGQQTRSAARIPGNRP